MQIDLSRYDQSRISQVLCVLLKYNIKNTKIEAQIEDPKQKKNLIEKLKASKLVHAVTDKVPGDQTKTKIGLIKPSVGANFALFQKNEQNAETMESEVTNPDQIYYVNHLLGESELIKLARDFKISMKTNSEKMIVSGAKNVVERIMRFVSNIECVDCEPISFETGLCLRNTKYFNQLSNKYKLTIALRQNRREAIFWLSLFGSDKKRIEDCSNEIGKAAKKIILLKFDKDDQPWWNVKKLFQYLQKYYIKRLKGSFAKDAIKYEVDIIESKYLSQPILYIWLDCTIDLFQQIKDWAQDNLKLMGVVRCNQENLILWQYYKNLVPNGLCFRESHKNSGCFYGKKKHIKQVFAKMSNLIKHKINSHSILVSLNRIFRVQDGGFNCSERSLVSSKGCIWLSEIFDKARERSIYKKISKLDKYLYTIRKNNDSGKVQSSQIINNFLKTVTPEMLDLLRQNCHNFSLAVQKILKMYSPKNKLHSSITRLFDKNQSSYSFVWMDVFCWNAQSLQKKDKFDYLEYHKADIQLVQEIWSPPKHMLSNLQNCRYAQREGKKGGGTLVNLATPHLRFKKEIPVDIDTKLYKLQLFSQKSIWVASVYLNQGKVEQVVQLFTILRQIVPHEQRKYILMAGDWNIDLFTVSHKLKVLEGFCQEFGLQLRWSKNPTRITAALDFVAVGSGIDVGEIKVVESISDHKAIRFKIRLPSI